MDLRVMDMSKFDVILGMETSRQHIESSSIVIVGGLLPTH